MRVLVAFDKFRDSLTAERAGAIAAREIKRIHPDSRVTVAALTDGGEGFARTLTETIGGTLLNVPVSGPRLERIEAPLGLVEAARIPTPVRERLQLAARAGGERFAVIEMASASGLALVPPDCRDPWRTTTYGTGQLIRAAAELGAAGIILGIGGSATNDLGLGALGALGFEFRSSDGAKLRPPFPYFWEKLSMLDGAVFPSIPPIRIACDVENPLLGTNGATAVFGPQKGLRAADLAKFESLMQAMAFKLAAHCRREPAPVDQPGTGAAGGIAYGLQVAARAHLVGGSDLVADWLQLDEKIAAADIIVTGEGCFDATSLRGKATGRLLAAARAHQKRAFIFAGATGPLPAGADGELHLITPDGQPLPAALREGGRNLAATVARVFTELSL